MKIVENSYLKYLIEEISAKGFTMENLYYVGTRAISVKIDEDLEDLLNSEMDNGCYTTYDLIPEDMTFVFMKQNINTRYTTYDLLGLQFSYGYGYTHLYEIPQQSYAIESRQVSVIYRGLVTFSANEVNGERSLSELLAKKYLEILNKNACEEVNDEKDI